MGYVRVKSSRRIGLRYAKCCPSGRDKDPVRPDHPKCAPCLGGRPNSKRPVGGVPACGIIFSGGGVGPAGFSYPGDGVFPRGWFPGHQKTVLSQKRPVGGVPHPGLPGRVAEVVLPGAVSRAEKNSPISKTTRGRGHQTKPLFHTW